MFICLLWRWLRIGSVGLRRLGSISKFVVERVEGSIRREEEGYLSRAELVKCLRGAEEERKVVVSVLRGISLIRMVFFTGVKVAEMVAKTGKTLSQLLKELESEYGLLVSGREDASCPDELKQVVMEKLSAKIPNKIADTEILHVNRVDGARLILKDESWLLIRSSGTKPLIRIYGESTNKEKLQDSLFQSWSFLKTRYLNGSIIPIVKRAEKPRAKRI